MNSSSNRPHRSRPTPAALRRMRPNPARWTLWELALLTISVVMIASPLIAAGYALLVPTAAPAAPVAQWATAVPTTCNGPCPPATLTPAPTETMQPTPTDEPPTPTPPPGATPTSTPDPCNSGYPGPCDPCADTGGYPGPDPALCPTPTATAAPTATPEPTATAAPTATPDPTATAAPTSTPAPTTPPSLLAVSKSALGLNGRSVTTVAPGSEFLYSIKVDNPVVPPVPVQLDDSLPAGLEGVAVLTVQGGTCSITAAALSCQLTPTQSQYASVVFRVRVTAPIGARLDNTAMAAATTGERASGSAGTVEVSGSQVPSVPPAPAPTDAPAPTTAPAPTSAPAPVPTNVPAPLPSSVPAPASPPVSNPAPQPGSPPAPAEPAPAPAEPAPAPPEQAPAEQPAPSSPPAEQPAPTSAPSNPPAPAEEPMPSATAIPAPAAPVPPTAKPAVAPTKSPATARPGVPQPAAPSPTKAPPRAQAAPPTQAPAAPQLPTATLPPAPTPGPTLAPVVTPQPGQPSVRFNLDSSWGQVFVGDTFEFVVSLENVGAAAGGSSPLVRRERAPRMERLLDIPALNDVVMTNDLDPAWEILEAQAPNMQVSVVDQKVEAKRATLAGGELVTLTIKVRARSVDAAKTILNQARVRFAGRAEPLFSNVVSVKIVPQVAPTPTAAPTAAPTDVPTPQPTDTAPIIEELGQADLPHTSGGAPMAGVVLLGLTMLMHSVRVRRSRFRI